MTIRIAAINTYRMYILSESQQADAERPDEDLTEPAIQQLRDSFSYQHEDEPATGDEAAGERTPGDAEHAR